MALRDFFKRRSNHEKAVTDDSKYMESSVSLIGGSNARGQSPPFSMNRSVGSFESWVYAAAMLNAQAAASVPLRLYVRTDAQATEKVWRTRKVGRKQAAYLRSECDAKPSLGVVKSAALAGDFEEVTDAHPVLELLRKASDYEDGFSQSVLRMLYLELTGNAYLHCVTDETLDVPSALYTVPAQHVTIVPSETTLIDAYLYGTNSQSMRRFETDEIIHFKRPNPRSLYYGLGKVEAAWSVIQQSTAAHVQDLSFLDNMSRPDYAAIIKGGSSEASMRRFEESMRSLHQGTRKSGRMVAISGDIQLMPLNFPAKDLTGRDDIVEEIAAVFGVPVSMLKANDPNLASAQAGYSMWRETTIAPICRLDEETLNSRLLPLFGIESDAFLAYDNPVPANRLADSQERATAVAGGWRTPNEARLEEGYEPLESAEADALHVGGQPLGGIPTAVNPFSGVPLSVGSSATVERDISPPSESAAAPSANLTLNEKQVSSAKDILLAVASREISASAAIALLSALGIPSETAREMVEAQVGNATQPAIEAPPTAKALESDDEREERLDRTRMKIASMEAKAWDEVQHAPKIASLEAELAEIKQRSAALDDIVTMLAEALGEDALKSGT